MAQDNKPEGKEPNKDYTIIVNAREKTVTERELTFDQIIALAFDSIPTGENIVFTVAYRKSDHHKAEGTLVQGETVKIKNGTIFNVTATDKS